MTFWVRPLAWWNEWSNPTYWGPFEVNFRFSERRFRIES